CSRPCPAVFPNVHCIVEETRAFCPEFKPLENVIPLGTLQLYSQIPSLIGNRSIYTIGKIGPWITNKCLVVSINNIIAIQIAEFKIARCGTATLNSVSIDLFLRLEDTINNPTIMRGNRCANLC